MPNSSIVSRLKEIERRITNITELQRMEKVQFQGDCTKVMLKKACSCPHHKGTFKRLRDHCVCANKPNTGDFCPAKICQPRQPCYCKGSKLIETINYSADTKPHPYDLANKHSKKLNEPSTHSEGIQVSQQDTWENISIMEAVNDTERNNEDNREESLAEILSDKNVNQRSDTLLENGSRKSFIKSEITSKDVDKEQVSKLEIAELRQKQSNSELKIVSKSKSKDKKRTDESAHDKLSQSQIQEYEKDLMNERKRNQELEEKLRNMTCSLECLKKDGEQRAACMREATEKAEEQANLAARSRNVAMELAKQSRDQMDIMKASKDELQKNITVLRKEMEDVMCKNTKLKCECEKLKGQLKAACETEAKKCAEVVDEVGRIKCAVKQKEDIMSTEKNELQEMIAELTNVIKIQKKRLCELTGVCSKQQEMLRNKDAEICDLQCKLKSAECNCHDVEDEIQTLKSCLNEEAKASDNFKRELDSRNENHCCELKIKEKIILDQEETISRLKKLLNESEKMAQQAAREFEQLADQIYSEKQTNSSLRIALETAEAELANGTGVYCERCETLEADLECLRQQKQKALITAKYAAEKLCETTKNYQKQIECGRRQQEFLTIVAHKKEEEIRCLRQEVLHSRQIGKRGLNDYMA